MDCCRNHPTYGPLWNSVAITDLLNVVYSGATRVPSQLGYFNATVSYFCIMGAVEQYDELQYGRTHPVPAVLYI